MPLGITMYMGGSGMNWPPGPLGEPLLGAPAGPPTLAGAPPPGPAPGGSICGGYIITGTPFTPRTTCPPPGPTGPMCGGRPPGA